LFKLPSDPPSDPSQQVKLASYEFRLVEVQFRIPPLSTSHQVTVTFFPSETRSRSTVATDPFPTRDTYSSNAVYQGSADTPVGVETPRPVYTPVHLHPPIADHGHLTVTPQMLKGCVVRVPDLSSSGGRNCAWDVVRCGLENGVFMNYW